MVKIFEVFRDISGEVVMDVQHLYKTNDIQGAASLGRMKTRKATMKHRIIHLIC